MKKMNSTVTNLNNEIQAVLTENEIIEYNKHPIKNALLNIKDKVLLTSPIILGITTFITKSDILLLATFLSVGAETANIYFNYKEEQQFEEKVISKKEHEKYFNKVYKAIYEEYAKTHQEEIEKINIKSNIHLINDNNLNKEETKDRLLYELDRYYDAYDLPILYLNTKETNELIDKTYKFFVNNNIEDKYYQYMSLVFRLTLARALVDESEELKLNDFLNNLSYINVLEPNISKESINELQNNINKINIFNIKRLRRIK